jgi:hypothetical protein
LQRPAANCRRQGIYFFDRLENPNQPHAQEPETMNSLELMIEDLERRCMLAGTVTVEVVNEQLRLVGDNDSNEVSIHLRLDSDGGVISGGIYGVNGTGIQYGGLPGTAVDLSDSGLVFIDDININLRNGDNQLLLESTSSIHPLELAGDVTIRTGNGNDGITLSDVVIGDDLSIRTKNGDDTVLMFQTETIDQTQIATSGGNDAVYLFETGHGDRLSVNTSRGDDAVLLSNNQLQVASRILLGGGDDALDAANLTLPNGSVARGSGGFDRGYVSSVTGGTASSFEMTGPAQGLQFLTYTEMLVSSFSTTDEFVLHNSMH